LIEKLNSQMLSWPADWTAVFGVDRPLIVEIGFGQGTFLLHLARSNPNANVIGLEIANRSLLKTEDRIQRSGLSNVRAIHSMAETALYHLFIPASITQIHINFPDPWFKKDHVRRRLMQRDTLDAMISRLVVGGELYLATDIREYAEMVGELLSATSQLENQLSSPWANSLPGRVVTKYEAIARREGRECYYFAYRRNDLPAPEVPVVKELPMPHIVFASPLSLEDMAARFEPQVHIEDETTIRLMSAYRGRIALLVETYVGEPTIHQHIALMITERSEPDTPDSNEYTIQLATIGQPRPTTGIHAAVTLLGDWILSLHPQNRIVKEKVSRE
jgi:tRNA (guanine-N7-)-methyltransferase